MANDIALLDCTLRDGGYLNEWSFGRDTIRHCLALLVESGVEYIECGYLDTRCTPSQDSTRFRDLDSALSLLPTSQPGQRFALMIDFGAFEIDTLPCAMGASPVIRVCFHKHDASDALAYCSDLAAKGYGVFVQPMVAPSYSDAEFTELIESVNRLRPAGFYIVDSFGSMSFKDFDHYLELADRYLADGMCLGYHAHDNLQQAYENSRHMCDADLSHPIVIDASINGMGRGAGNLNMELFASYLNDRFGKAYRLDRLLEILDVDLKPILAERHWDYSLPYYLSAKYGCHPNYASYLADKNTLSFQGMERYLSSLSTDAKISFSRREAERHYNELMRHSMDDRKTLAHLRGAIGDRDVLILAPGKSLRTERSTIEHFMEQHDCVVFGVGPLPDFLECDYLFCSNERRLERVKANGKAELIVTSNLDAGRSESLCVDYASHLTGDGKVADNPVLMLLRVLIDVGIQKVAIAGFDGYGFSAKDNYYDPKLAMGSSMGSKIERNRLIAEAMDALEGQLSVRYLTPSLYSRR